MTDVPVDATTRRGLAAARTVARRLDLPHGDARVLSARGNLVVHLAPAPVVARVATLTAWSRADPAAWLRRELVVARHAVARGAAVLAPAVDVDPGPHVVGPDPVTLWAFAAVGSRRPAPAEAGTALATLHAAVADLPAALPWLTPVHDQVDDALDAARARGLLPAPTVAALRARRDEAAARIDAAVTAGSPVGVLHGDAHAGNLVAVGDRLHWTDLEETCRGPLAWDLAVLAASSGPHGGPRALEAWTAASGIEIDPGALAACTAARRVEAAAWLTCMADRFPARYARLAPRAVEEALRPGG